MFDVGGIKGNNVAIYRLFCSNIRITDLDIKKAPKIGAFKKTDFITKLKNNYRIINTLLHY